MHSCRVLRVQGMFINDQVIVFIFCIPYEQVLIMNNNKFFDLQQQLCIKKQYVKHAGLPTGLKCLIYSCLYRLSDGLEYFVENILPQHPKTCAHFCSWQRPPFILAKILIQLNHLWSSSKMEQGTTSSFLASHRPFSSLSQESHRNTPR